MSDSQESIAQQDPAILAACLRRDQILCGENQIPSPLAMQLPTSPCPLLDAISRHLVPNENIPASIRMLQCQGVINGIRASINQMDHQTSADEIHKESAIIPTAQEFKSALKVLDYLRQYPGVSMLNTSSPLPEVIASVQTQLAFEDGLREVHHRHSVKASNLKKGRMRTCYMCHFQIAPRDAHDMYPALCRPCGSFNLSSSAMSLPESLNLSGKTALVTGGRINLGYHTALRLLRCGACVIVSSRYPRDAVVRYQTEPDFASWSERLRVVGADFRTARDAFRLVAVVRQLLNDWNGENQGAQSLDILINNAAQTLTDPVRSETRAIMREEQLDTGESQRLIAHDGEHYTPKLRGGVQSAWAGIEDRVRLQIGDGTENPSSTGPVQKGLWSDSKKESSRSSWVQHLHQIPYEDVVSAQAVNAFVPLILCRELLPFMGSTTASAHPLGYIVNVSSREGILETDPRSSSKAGHHVHTNMSKAALNMITETESETAWKRHVAMNTVDPGYMSAAPECQRPDGCPIGFEDGAGRVLWPVAIGEQEKRVIRGRFLKHFGLTDAIVSRC
ncbi:hypothetical protein BDV25DRAFT_103647 [Aspergillus avenaceus]|uniref:Short-chain dehydrogenase n=1 Tax=Aspergillus avenaceus TaxID=36643 RepID=A0A5N6TXF7_ASPAV|nr:hypothetical protein BDV25DRAFT_103647 [Aspergillus avenaceus]